VSKDCATPFAVAMLFFECAVQTDTSGKGNYGSRNDGQLPGV
jgi:hypothetical protein